MRSNGVLWDLENQRVILLDDSNPSLTLISSLKFCVLTCGETLAYELPDKSKIKDQQKSAALIKIEIINPAIDYFYLYYFSYFYIDNKARNYR